MSVHAFRCVQHVMDEYRSFLRSTYKLADEKLRAQFEAQIAEADVIVKGPYVTLSRDFKVGHALSQMEKKEAFVHDDLPLLKWKFGDLPLYRHQERALRAVEESNRGCVVKTGTGSGKTEAFLLPVINGVLRMREQGVPGTKALLLYPMNSLANDQLIRIRDLVRDSGLGLTFAMYTGESESVATGIGDGIIEGNELYRRADSGEIRQT